MFYGFIFDYCAIVKGGSISKNVIQNFIAKTVQTSYFVLLNLEFKWPGHGSKLCLTVARFTI